MTKTCRHCHRKLSNPISISRGYGDECAKRELLYQNRMARVAAERDEKKRLDDYYFYSSMKKLDYDLEGFISTDEPIHERRYSALEREISRPIDVSEMVYIKSLGGGMHVERITVAYGKEGYSGYSILVYLRLIFDGRLLWVGVKSEGRMLVSHDTKAECVIKAAIFAKTLILKKEVASRSASVGN